MQIFNLSNYKDPVYRNILLFCLLSFTAIGDVLLPLLNYKLLELPGINHNYINYTTLINTIPTLPFMFSIILGIIANRFNYPKLLKVLIMLSIPVGVALIGTTANLSTLLCTTLSASLIFRIIYLALDKHLADILLNKINDFQSDLFILGSILGIVCYKLSAVIYTNFHSLGLIAVFIILSIGALYFAALIPLNNNQQTIKLTQYKLILNKFIKNISLIQFALSVLIFNLISGCYNSYIMLVLKEQQTTPTIFANLNSISMFIGLILALIPKQAYTRQLYTLLLVSLYIFSLIMLLIQINVHNLSVYYISINALSSLIYIINNIIIFKLIGNDSILKTNAPIFLGIWATILYINGLCSQVISNIGLKYLINHHYLFAYGLVFILIMNTLYMSIKKPAI